MAISFPRRSKLNNFGQTFLAKSSGLNLSFRNKEASEDEEEKREEGEHEEKNGFN